MINQDALLELFYGAKPKIVWRMSIEIRQELLKFKSGEGNYLVCSDYKFENFTLFGQPIEIIAEDKLELVYVFSDGTEKVFKLELSN